MVPGFRSTPMAAAVLCVAATVALSGCGGGSSGGVDRPASGGASAGADTDQLVEFAKCLRGQGVDVADPKAGQGLAEWIESTGVDASQLRKSGAMAKCQDKLPPGIKAYATDPAKKDDLLLKFAQCMRKNGVDMPDPKNGRPDFGDVDRDSPAYKTASEKCRKELPGLAR
ncbi:hypothetical protein GCM10023191_058390 [Actinoallomurus oryzae]|uniref:Lipoprotein n=1 Tax=Actinoallomurus oryzae TaxID=502180 RepID=A0ABP8QKU6_9ACTN